MMDVISGLAGAMLSLVFSYVPGVKEWFEGLDGTQKRLVMLGLLVLAAVMLMVLACSGLAVDFGVQAAPPESTPVGVLACDRAGIVALVRAFLAAAVVNQTAYMLTPKSGEAALASKKDEGDVR